MKKTKKGLAILLFLLSGVFAYNYNKQHTSGGPALSLSSGQDVNLKDSVANNAAHVKQLIDASSNLSLPSSNDANLKDSVAESPAFETPHGQGNNQQNDGPSGPPPSPRGFNNGGFSNPGGQSPSSQLHQNNPPGHVSTSGPRT